LLIARGGLFRKAVEPNRLTLDPRLPIARGSLFEDWPKNRFDPYFVFEDWPKNRFDPYFTLAVDVDTPRPSAGAHSEMA
jgi:hypothetical protein